MFYCGRKTKLPRGKNRFGTPNECYLKGRQSGFIGGISKGLVPLTVEGLNPLSKDVIRDIAYKFRVPSYSRLSKEGLITAILRVKTDNVKTFNLDDLKNRTRD